MLKTTTSVINASQITGVLPVVNGGTGVTTSTGTGNTVLSAAPTLSGNVTLSTGNLIVASGQGIDFSATSSGSGTMTSELLADYEEGTFTPSYTGSGGNPTVTYGDQIGYYTKIGRVVTFGIRLTTSSSSGGGGNLRISGLPFSFLDNSGGTSMQFSFAFASNVLQANLQSTNLLLSDSYAGTANTASPVTALTSAGGATFLIISGTYMV